MHPNVELSQVGIKLKDGTVYILEGPEIVNVELTLEDDADALWTSDGSPFLAAKRATAHMHLHLVSPKLVMSMDTGPEELEAKDLVLELGEGDDHGQD